MLVCNTQTTPFWQSILPFWHFFIYFNYVVIIRISCRRGLYFFKYFPFTFRIRLSSASSSISYALFENVFTIRKGPSQWGDHLPNALFFLSMGNMTFHTRLLTLNVLPFTLLLYALTTLSFCLISISNACSLTSSNSINSFIIISQYNEDGRSYCLWIRTDCR